MSDDGGSGNPCGLGSAPAARLATFPSARAHTDTGPPALPPSLSLAAPSPPMVPAADSLSAAMFARYWPTITVQLDLTPRQGQVLSGIWHCMTNDAIAEQLRISIAGVDNHWRAIKKKLNAATRLDAVHKVYAIIIELHDAEVRGEESHRGD
jgi:DNA-binding CsgD family transcriptional regulator